MPRAPRSGSVTAMQMAISARAPFVVKVLLPFSTQSAPSRTAVVFVPAASLPALGSVRLQAPSAAPEASGFRNRSRCSSVPCS